MANKGGYYMEKDLKLAAYFHPGVTLADKLNEMGLSDYEFSQISGLDSNCINGIINTNIDVDENIAKILEKGTGIPAYAWLKQQEIFNHHRIETILKQLTRDVKKDLYGRKQSIKESEKELRRIVECL